MTSVTVLLNLVSDQITPIILGAMQYRPSHMVFIRSNESRFEQNVQRICAFLKQRFDFTHEEIIVHAFDLEDILEKMRSIDIKAAHVRCNITGGTKLMAIAALQAMNEKQIPSFYIDTDNNQVITIHDAEIHTESIVSRLTVSDFAQMTGAVISSEQTSMFRENKGLSELSELIFRDQAGWKRTNRFFHAAQCKYPSESLLTTTPFKFSDPQRNSTVQVDFHFMRELSRIGFIEDLRITGGKVSFRFKDQAAKTILLNFGLWLEYFVFDTIVQLQELDGLQTDDLRAGVVLNWGPQGTAQNQVTNELDVMVTRSSKLFCISCKAGAKIKDIAKVLNEIELYSRRLGGIYYYPALVLTAPPDAKMIKRAELTRVKLFVADDSLRGELAKWLGK